MVLCSPFNIDQMVRNFKVPLLKLLESGGIDLCFANEDEAAELLRSFLPCKLVPYNDATTNCAKIDFNPSVASSFQYFSPSKH